MCYLSWVLAFKCVSLPTSRFVCVCVYFLLCYLYVVSLAVYLSVCLFASTFTCSFLSISLPTSHPSLPHSPFTPINIPFTSSTVLGSQRMCSNQSLCPAWHNAPSSLFHGQQSLSSDDCYTRLEGWAVREREVDEAGQDAQLLFNHVAGRQTGWWWTVVA